MRPKDEMSVISASACFRRLTVLTSHTHVGRAATMRRRRQRSSSSPRRGLEPGWVTRHHEYPCEISTKSTPLNGSRRHSTECRTHHNTLTQRYRNRHNHKVRVQYRNIMVRFEYLAPIACPSRPSPSYLAAYYSGPKALTNGSSAGGVTDSSRDATPSATICM